MLSKILYCEYYLGFISYNNTILLDNLQRKFQPQAMKWRNFLVLIGTAKAFWETIAYWVFSTTKAGLIEGSSFCGGQFEPLSSYFKKN